MFFLIINKLNNNYEKKIKSENLKIIRNLVVAPFSNHVYVHKLWFLLLYGHIICFFFLLFGRSLSLSIYNKLLCKKKKAFFQT